jgi:hypothetical protein
MDMYGRQYRYYYLKCQQQQGEYYPRRRMIVPDR